MDADSVVLARDTGEEAYNFGRRITAKRLECQRAVLATAPAEGDLLALRQPLRRLPRQKLPAGVCDGCDGEVSGHYRRGPGNHARQYNLLILESRGQLRESTRQIDQFAESSAGGLCKSLCVAARLRDRESERAPS